MRLFVSVNFPDDVADFLYDKVIRLKNEALSMAPSERKNLHLTLAFIGKTENVDKVKDILSEISFSSFEITISGLGKFEGDGGDIWWAGLDKNENYGKLEELAFQIQNRLRCAGFDIEEREYSPHITLGRRITLEREASFDVPFYEVGVSRISLMNSQRIGGRIVYTEIFGKDAT